MPYNELKSISNSIAGYCVNKQLKQPNRRSSVAFRKTQALKGAKGGKKGNSSNGGKARSKKYEHQREKARQMHKQGKNKSEIARNLGVARATLIRWLA